MSAYENVLGFYHLWIRDLRLSFREVDDMLLDLLFDMLIVQEKLNGDGAEQKFIDDIF